MKQVQYHEGRLFDRDGLTITWKGEPALYDEVRSASFSGKLRAGDFCVTYDLLLVDDFLPVFEGERIDNQDAVTVTFPSAQAFRNFAEKHKLAPVIKNVVPPSVPTVVPTGIVGHGAG